MDVAVVNAVLLTIVLFAEPMATGLRTVLTGNHLKPNDGILQALASAHLGTPFSLVLLSMILLFVGFAVRDAYDSARGEKLKPIYADSALHLSEAASGSYLFHFSAMISCAVFALFFLIPKPEQRQITEIIFVPPPQIKDVEPVKPKKFSSEAAQAKPRDVQVKKPTPPASAASRAQAQPARQPQTAARQPASATLVKPVPTLRSAPSASHTPAPLPISAAPKVVSPSLATNSTPMPTSTKSSPASAPGPILAMLPPSLTGTGPVPVALSHSPTASNSAPMPAAGKRSLHTTSSGPPAPNLAVSSTSADAPAPIIGSHAPGQSKSHEVGAPTKIASTSGPIGESLLRPVGPVGPAKVSSTPHTDSTGESPASGTGRNDQPIGKADFGAYMAELQRRIKRNWQPPKDPTSRQVVVEFQIFRSGELGSVRLSRSSGLAKNDQAAIDAIRAAAPYSPLPKFADQSVDIQFTFDYHVFGGHASF